MASRRFPQCNSLLWVVCSYVYFTPAPRQQPDDHPTPLHIPCHAAIAATTATTLQPPASPLLLAGGADRLAAAARGLGVLPAHAHAPVVADTAVGAVWW